MEAEQQQPEVKIREPQFLPLGVIKFKVKIEQWQHWHRKMQNELEQIKNNSEKNDNQKSNIFNKFKSLNNKNRFCQLKKPDQQGYYFRSQYNLEVTTQDGLQVNIFRSVQLKTYCMVQIQNLIDLEIIRLRNPFCFELTKNHAMIDCGQMTFMNYFVSTPEIGVKVYVSSQYLNLCSEHYQKHCQYKLKVYKMKKYIEINEEDSFDKKMKYFAALIRSLYTKQEQKKKKIELNQIKYQYKQQKQKQQQQKQNQKQQQKQKNQQKQKDEYDDHIEHHPQQIKDLLDVKEEEKQHQVISYNFINEFDAGQFFDLFDCDIEPYEKPKHFKGELKIYQKKALSWMLYRQGLLHNDSLDKKSVDTPFWKDLRSELYEGPDFNLFLNDSIHEIMYNDSPIKKCKGGILADQMGLGKTVMMISLILAHRPIGYNSKKTLIVAPVSLLQTWKSQIQQFAPALNVCVFHGKKNLKDKIEENEIIITSQGKIRAQKLRSQNNQEESLTDIEWFRVIVDEAHNFRNHKTKMFGALFSLKSEYKWCLSGTPKQNSTHDLFSFCKFLEIFPWNLNEKWEAQFPKNDKDIKDRHVKTLKQILKGVMLRRKKNSLDQQGNKLLELPKVDIKLHYVKMSKQARAVYRLLNGQAAMRLQILQNIDKLKTLKNLKIMKRNLSNKRKYIYSSILGLIMKMRMICCHAFLYDFKRDFVCYEKFRVQYAKFLGKLKVQRSNHNDFFETIINGRQAPKTKKLNKVYGYYDRKLDNIQRGYKENCGLCGCSDANSIITPCLHFFCSQCIEQHFRMIKEKQDQKQTIYEFYEQTFEVLGKKVKNKEQKLKDFAGECPVCHDELKLRQVYDVPRENQFGISIDLFRPNDKINELINYLNKMESHEKAVIYTNFIGMIRLISRTLDMHQITHLTLEGRDNLGTRNTRIQQFNNNPNIKALIITLKIGSVGLNLQSANKVFIMDPWWNPAIEQQAIARTHRFGQKKEVLAVKFITLGSIQAKIIKDSHNKKKIIDSIMDIDEIEQDKRYTVARPQIKQLLQVDEDQGEMERAEELEKDEQNEKFMEAVKKNMEAKAEAPFIKMMKQQMNKENQLHKQNNSDEEDQQLLKEEHQRQIQIEEEYCNGNEEQSEISLT